MIKYKKGSTKKLADIISRGPTSNITTFGTLMHILAFAHDAHREAYSEDDDFKVVYQQLKSQSHMNDGDNTIDYHLQDELHYILDKLCVPKGECLQPIREAHTLKVAGKSGVGNVSGSTSVFSIYWSH